MYKKDINAAPYCNTAQNRQSPHESPIQCGLDYLVVTGSTDVTKLIDAVWAGFGTSFNFEDAKRAARGRVYDIVATSAQGIELSIVALDDGATEQTYRLSIPGKPLKHISEERLAEFIAYLYDIGAKATRLDWRIDDYERKLDIGDCVRACERGDFCGGRTWREIRGGRRGSKSLGHTLYIGSSLSKKMVRIYDKREESGGQIDCIRFEVQWRETYAHAAFEKLLSPNNRQLQQQDLSNLAIGSCGFIDRSSEVLSRCPELPFWREFVARVGVQTKLSIARLQTMISDKINWIETKVSATIALISKAKGFDQTLNWLERLMREKAAKPRPGDVAYLDSWRDRITVERGGFEDWMVMRDWSRV